MKSFVSDPPPVHIQAAVATDKALRARCLDAAYQRGGNTNAKFVLKCLAFGLSCREISFHYGRLRERDKYPRHPRPEHTGDVTPDRPDLIRRNIHGNDIAMAKSYVARNLTEQNQLHDNWPVVMPYIKSKKELEYDQREYAAIKRRRAKAWHAARRAAKSK